MCPPFAPHLAAGPDTAVRPEAPGAFSRHPGLYDAVLVLPAEVSRVRLVRRFTEAAVTHWRVSPDEREAAVLVADELAANAAQHGRGEMTLSLARHADTLHIEVADHGTPCVPEPRGADPDEHGRGIAIVEALATRVEVRQDAYGCRVHAVLRVSPHPRFAPAPTAAPCHPEAAEYRTP